MDFNVSVDLGNLQAAIDRMKVSRGRLYASITQLNEIRKRFLDGEIWQGDGADVAIAKYSAMLNAMLREQKRLNELEYQLGNYVVELTENERKVAQAAEQVNAN